MTSSDNTYTLTEDDRRLVQRALFEYANVQERKLRRLRKSAGGRNWRANEMDQDNRSRERTDALALRERLSSEYVANLQSR